MKIFQKNTYTLGIACNCCCKICWGVGSPCCRLDCEVDCCSGAGEEEVGGVGVVDWGSCKLDWEVFNVALCCCSWGGDWLPSWGGVAGEGEITVVCLGLPGWGNGLFIIT